MKNHDYAYSELTLSKVHFLPAGGLGFVSFILLFLYLSKRMGNSPSFKEQDRFYVNITTDLTNIVSIDEVLNKSFSLVELKPLERV